MSVPTRFDPVVVTGAAGFVGACAVRALVDRGHEVHAVVGPSSDCWRLAGLGETITVHRVDLAEPVPLRRLFDAVAPRSVVHLAAHGAYERQDDFQAMVRTNLLGTSNLLAACHAVGLAVLINGGSSSEYGFKPGPMSECDRLEPNSHYAVTKAAQTHLCSLWGSRLAADVGVVTFRLFSVYGPWEEPSRLIPTLIRRARAGLPLEMVGPATARDFVYIDDVVAALLDFERVVPLHGDVINLGTGNQTTLRALVALVLELTGTRPEVRWGAMAARRWDAESWVADTTRARQCLGWTAAHDLRKGLVKTMDWFTEVGDGPRARSGVERVAG